MEDVLEVYYRPYDPLWPMVTLDELSKQLISETRPSLPPRPDRSGVSIRSTVVTGRPACFR